MAVSRDVEQELEATGHPVGRVSGADRYETATRLADRALQAGADGGRVWVVSGTAFPDALASGPAAWTRDALIVLTDPQALSERTESWLQAHADTIDEAVVIGGPDAIARAVDDQVRAAIG